MPWRVAEALDALLAEIDERAPKRSKVSDGSIGDAAHASRDSDHNPWAGPGIVTARDFTHDPDAGADMNVVAEHLRESQDPRIKYVIWDRRMFSSYPTSSTAAWQWRPYTGSNTHTKHLHLSVQPDPDLYDSTDSWGWAVALSKEDVDRIADAILRSPYGDGTNVKGAINAAAKRTEKLVEMVEAIAAGDQASAKKIAKAVREDLAAALKE